MRDLRTPLVCLGMGRFESRRYSVAFVVLFARGIIAPVVRPICLIFINLFLVAGIAKASPAIPAIPIQIINTNAGRVMTAHAEKYDDKVYVTGLVYRPSSPGIGAHIHVWGVDKKGHTIFFKTTYVMITGRPSLHRTESYVISVNPSMFDNARTVFVTFHSQSDAISRKEDTP